MDIPGKYIGLHVSFYDTREEAEASYESLGYNLTLRPYYHEYDKYYGDFDL